MISKSQQSHVIQGPCQTYSRALEDLSNDLDSCAFHPIQFIGVAKFSQIWGFP